MEKTDWDSIASKLKEGGKKEKIGAPGKSKIPPLEHGIPIPKKQGPTIRDSIREMKVGDSRLFAGKNVNHNKVLRSWCTQAYQIGYRTTSRTAKGGVRVWITGLPKTKKEKNT